MTDERNVTCKRCGEVVAFRNVGTDGDDSDILVPPTDCPLCLESELTDEEIRASRAAEGTMRSLNEREVESKGKDAT